MTSQMSIFFAMNHANDEIDYEPRRVGNNPTIDNKRNSNDELEQKNKDGLSKKQIRYNQILEILTERNKPMTAKEIAKEMMLRGYTRTDERNNSAPRLTELGQRGIVEPKGSKMDNETNKRVTVWGLV